MSSDSFRTRFFTGYPYTKANPSRLGWEESRRYSSTPVKATMHVPVSMDYYRLMRKVRCIPVSWSIAVTLRRVSLIPLL